MRRPAPIFGADGLTGHEATHKKATITLARQRFKTMYRIMIEGVDYDLNKLVKSTMERSNRS